MTSMRMASTVEVVGPSVRMASTMPDLESSQPDSASRERSAKNEERTAECWRNQQRRSSEERSLTARFAHTLHPRRRTSQGCTGAERNRPLRSHHERPNPTPLRSHRRGLRPNSTGRPLSHGPPRERAGLGSHRGQRGGGSRLLRAASHLRSLEAHDAGLRMLINLLS